MENIKNIEGLKLVIDRRDGEFYLLAFPDRSGFIHGKIKDPMFLFNIGRGIHEGGIFSGSLVVNHIPFEYLKYNDARIEHLLESTTKKEIKIVEYEFEYFNPAKFESGEEIIPPRSLSRKQRKTWYRESKQWKESTKDVSEASGETVIVSDVLPSGDSNSDSSGSGDDNGSNQRILDNDPQSVQQDSAVADKVIDLPSINETMEKAGVDWDVYKEKLDPVAGKGNTECQFVDYPQGYMLAYFNPKTNVYAVLGTPTYPDIQGFRRFFVCDNQRSAQMLLDKLKDHPYYSKFVKDGNQECKVYPITNLPVDKWNVPALHVVDVMKLLNSRLMV